jgi:membrane associated rhomboid family serine protease
MARSPRILDDPSPGGSPPEQQPPPSQPRQRWPVVSGTVLVGSIGMAILHIVVLMASDPSISLAAALMDWPTPLALWGPLVEQGQYWRMFSMAFEHGGPIHLLFNMSVVYTLGFMLERAIGSWRFLGICIVTALGSSAFALLFNFDVPTVGASGMILGWAGAMVPIATEQGRRELGTWLVQVVIISLLPGVSWAGHLGGFLFGIPCGVALRMGRAVYTAALPFILFITAIVAMLAAHPKWR